MFKGIKIISFTDNQGPLKKMPVFVKDNLIIWAVFLLFFEVIVILFFYYIYLSNTNTNTNIVEGIFFLTIFSIMLTFFLIVMLKNGVFVMSADESGIFYKVCGKRNEFVLLEWHVIDRVRLSYNESGTSLLEVLTTVKNYDIPSACNATFFKSDTLGVSFSLPNAIKGSELKIQLDDLRVNCGKAKLF